ncbi:MAG: sugar phosphate isomerase/epimerase [Actinomycetales bacterium]|nr:sugar phosphate isomerase/epimerase [Actinomycetales bacterium]
MLGPIGLDSFSVHRYFGEHSRWEQPLTTRWQTSDFLDLVDRLDCAVASLETVYLGTDDEALYEQLQAWQVRTGRSCLFTWGHPDGLRGGMNPAAADDAQRYLHLSRELGATDMRIVCGNHHQWDVDPAQRRRVLRPLLERLADVGGEAGVRVSVENHADFTVTALVSFLEEIGHPNLGLCLDTGNCLRTGERPATVLAEIDMSRIFMVQAKDVRLLPGADHPVGWWPTTRFGTGDVDMAGCLRRLDEGAFTGPLVIELSNLWTGLTEIDEIEYAVDFLHRWHLPESPRHPAG